MNLHEEINLNFSPIGGLIIYKKTALNYMHSDEYYIEHHNLDENGSMLSGAPLTEDAVKELANYFYLQKEESERITGLIPDNLIYSKLNTNSLPDMIWYRPSQKMEMFFDDALNIPNGFASVPPLLFQVENSCLYIFALKEETRPNELTKLFLPPFHNCSYTGSVCMGSARAKQPKVKTWKSLIEYWELLFWKSKFSHLGDENTKENINLIWKKQVNNPDTPFNLNVLIDSSKNLNDIF